MNLDFNLLLDNLYLCLIMMLCLQKHNKNTNHIFLNRYKDRVSLIKMDKIKVKQELQLWEIIIIINLKLELV